MAKSRFIWLSVLFGGSQFAVIIVPYVEWSWLINIVAILEIIVFVNVISFLVTCYQSNPSPYKTQAKYFLVAMCAQGISLVFALVAVLKPQFGVIHFVAVLLSLKFALPLLIISTSYKVVPFFIASVDREYHLMHSPTSTFLRNLLLILLVDVLCFGLSFWIHSQALQMLQGIIMLLIAILVAKEVYRWWPGQTAFRHSLIGVLFLGLLWYIIGNFIWGVLCFVDSDARLYQVNLLHLFAMGSFLTVTVAIATRVSLGHANLAIRGSWAFYFLIICLQLATIGRVIGSHVFSLSYVVIGLPLFVAWCVWGVYYGRFLFYASD